MIELISEKLVDVHCLIGIFDKITTLQKEFLC